MAKDLFRPHFGYDVEKVSDASAVRQPKDAVSMTVQAHAEDADLNVLMRRYGVTGKMPENLRLPEYGDFEGISDFATALSSVERTASEFMRIPAEVRAKFDNDPQKFLMFVADEANDDYLRKVGLKVPLTQEQLAAREAKIRESPEFKLAEVQKKLDMLSGQIPVKTA